MLLRGNFHRAGWLDLCGLMKYEEYLRSAHWLDLRSRRIAKASGHCEGCGCRMASTDAWEVHHVRYRHPRTDTRLGDLMALCPPCHIRIESLITRPGQFDWNQTQRLLRPSKGPQFNNRPGKFHGMLKKKRKGRRRKWADISEEQRHHLARQRNSPFA